MNNLKVNGDDVVEVEALLMLIILLLLGVILFSGGGIVRRRQFLNEIADLRKERQRLLEVNEAFRSVLDKRFEDLFELVRNLESLKRAVEGSSVHQKQLTQKYGVSPGPELLKRILAARPSMDPVAKWKLAHEVLVGEEGRMITRSLSISASLEKAASNVGMPVTVARGQVKKLQTLGYLDASLKPTKLGREVLA